MRGAGVLAGLLALACACSSGPEAIHVRSVQLVGGAPGALAEAGLERAAVEDGVRTALREAGFRVGDGRRPHVAGVGVPLVRIGSGAAGPRAEVTVEVVLRPAAEEAPPRSEIASAAVPILMAGSPREAFARALADASRSAAEGLAVGVRAEGKRADALIADLAAKDLRVREEAVRVLGERRAREAVPALLAALEKEEPRLGHRIVAALAQIGDERAVPALIDLSGAADAALTTRLVRFIGDIGGPEAEGYLLTLSSGHPDRAVRDAARAALEELTQRAKSAPVATRSAKMPAP